VRTMYRIRFFALAVALVPAVWLSAQDQPPTEVPAAPIPGWTFKPGVAIALTYDSNVALTTAPASASHTADDNVLTVDPIGSLRYLGPRTEFDANYRGTFRRYATLRELNGYDQLANALFQRRATKRLTLFAQDNFQATPTTDELDLNAVPFRRVGTQTDRFATGMIYRFTEHTELHAGYDVTWVSFDRPELELTGGIINGFHTELTQRLTGRLTVGGEGSIRFANMDVPGGRQLRFIDVGPTVTYALDEETKLTAAVGFAHLDDELSVTTRTGPYVRAALTRIAARTVFGASYERSFVPSFGFGGSTQNQEVRGWVDLPPIGRRVFLQGAGAWRRSNPFETVDVRQLDTIQLRGSVGYAVSRWMRAQGFYLFTRQDSIITGGEVNRTRVGVELVVSQPMRIR
jgi:hypothetical protein